MDLGLRGKKALVTGGSHGIGRSIALSLAEEGCDVAICARNRDRINATADEVRAKGADCLGIQADVTVQPDVQRVMKEITGQWGTLHILVNNVGGGGRWGNEIIEETDEKTWHEVFEKNVMTAVGLTKLAIPLMRAQKWGRVVTITSIYGLEAGGRPWFSVAKMVQAMLMKSLSVKDYLAEDGITFNSVAPGAIMIPDTGWEKALKDNPGEVEEYIKRELPIGRFGTPEEVAGLVVFICSERASLINGASIAIDGGQSKSLGW